MERRAGEKEKGKRTEKETLVGRKGNKIGKEGTKRDGKVEAVSMQEFTISNLSTFFLTIFISAIKCHAPTFTKEGKLQPTAHSVSH